MRFRGFVANHRTSQEDECGALHATGLRCTLKPNHTGDHIAQTIDVRNILSWPRRDAPQAETEQPR